METLILMLSSVLGTLGIVLVIWLIFSVRSAQKQLKIYDESFPTLYESFDKEMDKVYRSIDDLKSDVDKRFEDSNNELDKRFDNSYRTMYEFRDWAKEQIERLIETDLQNK